MEFLPLTIKTPKHQQTSIEVLSEACSMSGRNRLVSSYLVFVSSQKAGISNLS